MQYDADIAIIGGGLAGLSAARSLLENPEVRVVVLDPFKSGKNNPTRLTFCDTLAQYDLLDCALEQYRAFVMITPTGVSSGHRFENPVLAGLNYLAACRKLEKQYLDPNPNFQLVRRKVTGFEDLGDGIRLTLSSGDQVRAKMAIDASGKVHLLGNLLGAGPVEVLYSHSLGLMYENCSHSVDDECYFIAGSTSYGSGGGWYYPVENRRASVGFAIVNDSVRFPAKDLKDNFHRAVAEFQPFAGFLKGARQIHYESGTIPVEPLEKMFYDRVLITGDAAGHATPWMCMGVEPALLNGDLAGRVARQAFEKGAFGEEALIAFQKQWDSRYRQAYEGVTKMPLKLWDMPDEVWDFLIQYDVSRLNAEQLLARMRDNGHTMSKPLTLMRWLMFKAQRKFKTSRRTESSLGERT